MALPLSLYIHIPWCVRKCPYCDFNSHAVRGGLPVDAYVDALLQDLDRDLIAHGQALAGRTITSIFFGGGTPSLFAPATIGRILEGVAARIGVEAGAEVTLETNPGTVEHGPFGDYMAAGVNRFSFGVQSFDDTLLARLGRIHSAAEAQAAVRAARNAGCENFNLDLMYALPGQDLAGALADLDAALALEPAHVSHYHLTLEPNTLFAARPPQGLPDADLAWDMQEACQQRLADAGFEHYEVSAYARPGRKCRHNRNYWSFGDYLGIGAGAHGKITGAGSIVRTTKIRTPEGYLARAAAGREFGTTAAVAAAELPFEFMLNALRLTAGVPLSLFPERTGLGLEAIAAPLAIAQARGWLETTPGLLKATDEGARWQNDLLELFLPGHPDATT